MPVIFFCEIHVIPWNLENILQCTRADSIPHIVVYSYDTCNYHQKIVSFLGEMQMYFISTDFRHTAQSLEVWGGSRYVHPYNINRTHTNITSLGPRAQKGPLRYQYPQQGPTAVIRLLHIIEGLGPSPALGHPDSQRCSNGAKNLRRTVCDTSILIFHH